MCPSFRVCCGGGVFVECGVACVLCSVCAESVCGMCVLCFGVCGVCCVCGVVCGAVCVAPLGTRKTSDSLYRSLLSFSSFVLFRRSLSSLCSSLFSACFSFFSVSSQLSVFLFSMRMTMTMIARPVGSLCTHGSDLPECQSAWAVAPSLWGEHFRIMQETCVLALLCNPRASWNEVGLNLCWKWVMCFCLVVLVCVVFVVLLVASVLASMSWLLCGGNVSKKKKSVIPKKIFLDRMYLHYGFN